MASSSERRVVFCRRPRGIGPNPSAKDAELIAFGVGEHHPGGVTLPDVGPASTEGKETIDFCGLIDRTEVRMESVLACLLLPNRQEQQARHPIRSRPDLELIRGVAHSARSVSQADPPGSAEGAAAGQHWRACRLPVPAAASSVMPDENGC